MAWRMVPTAVQKVKEGDIVDLEGDLFADPERDHLALAYDYQTVNAVDLETETCVVLWIEGFDAVGFPKGHCVRKMVEV